MPRRSPRKTCLALLGVLVYGAGPALHNRCRLICQRTKSSFRHFLPSLFLFSYFFLLLNLSRLNHRLPRRETHPEVMQGTTEFHDEIADAVLRQPDAVLHKAS